MTDQAAPLHVRDGDVAGQVEVRGFDYIPEDESHGEPRELFGVWAAANLSLLYLIYGGIVISLGLNIWQALAAIVLAHLSYLLIGQIAKAGPEARTPTITISRAMYGMRGNQLSAFLAWFNLVAFEALNFTLGALALYALADDAGIKVDDPIKAVLLALVIAGTFALAFYGHATIVKFYRYATWALAIGLALFFLFVLGDIKWDYSPKTPLSGWPGFATWVLAVGIVVSGGLSWCSMPADYSRYLPRSASKRAIARHTAFGGMLPAILLGIIAVLAGTAVDMSDPINSAKSIVPGWFYPIFLIVLLIGLVTNNVITVYSSGLSLQTLGLKVKRPYAVFVDAVIGTAMAVYATFIADFLTALTEFLQLMLLWYAPYTAIFLADMWLRRNRYDGVDLHRGTGSRYWARDGFHWPGVISLVGAMGVAALFADTTRFRGPISTHVLSGADISAIVGFVIGGGVYLLLARHSVARQMRAPAAIVVSDADPRQTAVLGAS